MNLNLFLSALRARFGVFALVLAATVLAATVVSLLLPKSYKATASVLVDATNRDEQSLSNVFVPPRERIGYMQTQMDIITSARVARKVVQDLKLAESPASREAFEKEAGGTGPIENWLAENLLRRLKVETSPISGNTIVPRSEMRVSVVRSGFWNTVTRMLSPAPRVSRESA